MSKSTGFIPNIKTLYHSYGGFESLIKSAYFWISLGVSACCWRFIADEKWAEMSKDILPQLAGFSVAAYALFFAVLDERTRNALRAPSDKLGGRSPLLILASSISHAVIIQIISVISALIYSSKPFPSIDPAISQVVNMVAGTVGMFLLAYGIVLVIAAVLSIFKILEMEANAG